ncbi:hypothetical protein BD626DRAFT_463561 [Schizophyllum amplum]|uniref:Uncharacterized protein n=1 Tax=Schizophyllum amplum TaxID=97359 RepID=A0A550C1I3_9AGAR|nr:hypothetical protein BD626DRAFT_463561 [Auriculariopsis ampla]
MSQYIPQKVDLTPRRHHGYAVVLFIVGSLFPPLAVAARFGVGKDFWINLLLTICGYIPGHGHNFYIQNIRNNKTHARTPKWVQRYGLVDISTIRRHERRSQWANRYKDRNPTSALEGQPYEEGQDPSTLSLSSDSHGAPATRRGANGELWGPEDEQYYNADANSSTSGGRWKYPANFDDAVMDTPKRGKKAKGKKDRWARTEDAYSTAEENSRRKKSKKKRHSTAASVQSSANGSTDFPEDPEGGLYGSSTPYASAGAAGPNRSPSPVGRTRTTDDDLNHQF